MSLKAKNICVFIHKRKIIDGVSIELERGSLIGLIGPNGAGKSTLLKTLAGVQNHTTGEILINGRLAEQFSAEARARTVAYLPQNRRIEWQLPARTLVMLGRFPHRQAFKAPSAACEAAVDRALSAVNATEFSKRSVTMLSQGESARVFLARALAVEAPFLLVDEPTADMDPYHQIHVMEILKNVAKSGVSILVVLHDLTLAARFMDKLLLMKQGQIVDSGAPKEILTAENLEHVYGISALNGKEGDRAYIIPWSRV